MIILDTNVLSEAIRPEPAPAVLRWLAAQAALFTTVISESEIFYGLALLPKGRRRDSLKIAAQRMFAEDFSDRVLPFDSVAARAFAEIVATRRRQGGPIGILDAQIAAIARAQRAALATRDVGEFHGCGIELLDPWAA